MKRKSMLLAVLLCLSVLLSACGSAANSEAMTGGMPADDGNYAPSVPASGLKGEMESPSKDSDIYISDSNKIIRTADLTIQSTEFDAAVQALNELTDRLDGYFEKASVEGGGFYDKYANRTAHYVVRVPKESFVAFRDGTGTIGHIYSISESTQDVGETYYDTEARLQTLTTKRDRLLALLEKADKMEDIISLENALAEVQYEMDRHNATLRKYDSLIGYSTFNIQLIEVVEITEEPAIKESFGSRFLSDLKFGFKNFGEELQDFALWSARNLIGIVIFAVVVVVVVLTTRKGLRRRRERKTRSE